MKFKSVFLIAFLSMFMLSCVDDLTNMGSQIQPASDKILVDTANFTLSSENYYVDSIVSRPDSMMLGSFYDLTYGTINADIFTQLQPPLDFKYPSNTTDPSFVLKADSAKVFMYFNTYFGDKNSPMEVNLYEMNKGNSFNFTEPYYSNINPSKYIDLNNKIKIGSKVFDASTASKAGVVEFNLTPSFVERFKPIFTKNYNKDNEADFQKFFNGIYITTDFGSASMLYVRGFNLKYYFHYEYTNSEKKLDTVRGNVSYPANQEVRQVNRFQHPNKEAVKIKLNSDPQINYISAPANVFTKVSVPLKKMKTRMNVGNKKLLVNRAVLKVDISDVNDSSLAQPIISTILMIKESAYTDFFKKRGLPSDTSAVVGTKAYQYNSTTKEFDFYYTFDLAKIISTEFKKSSLEDNINFILVPITQKTDGSGATTSYNQQNLMGAVKICSGKNKTKPMKIDMVYSGF